jgi:hypothetical protein
MLEGTGKKPPTFTQIQNAFRLSQLRENGEGEPLHGEVTEGGVWRLHTHAPLMPNGSGDEALARRLAMQKGAQLVKEAMIKQYGRDMTEAAFRKVSLATDRNLEEEITPSDLHVLRLHYEELHLQALRDRVLHGTTEVIKDDFARIWRFTAAAGYAPIRWPNSDATLYLPSRVHMVWIDHNNMQFDEEAGTLTLTQGSGHGGLENKLTSLTEFIRRHFQVEPGQAQFQNVANNILSYLTRGAAGLMGMAVSHDACPDLIAARSRFTLSVGVSGSVGVESEISIPYKNQDDDVVSLVDFSKYRFVRWESLEIEHLISDPREFDAKANLRSVRRVDTIEFADIRPEAAEVRAAQGALRA